MKNTTYLMILFSAMILSCSKNNSATNPTGLPEIGSASASDFSSIAETTASFNATIISEGGSSITAKGVCWSTNHNPTISDNKTTNKHGSGSNLIINKTNNGTGNTSFTASLTGLTPNTLYYLRIYATNNSGTGYSNEVSFTTSTVSNTVTDIDGNIYNTVVIGTQTWMLQNLKVKKYRNGIAIPNVTNSTVWKHLSSGAYCDYGNNTTVSATYGLLYNWYAVNDSRLIAPSGWHIPTQAEWQTLFTYLGGISVAASKLKEAGNAHWNDNSDANNSSGFTALPGGTRSGDSTDLSADYYDLNDWGYFWSATPSGTSNAYNYWLSHNFTFVEAKNNLKSNGYSIRCIKD